MLLVTLSFTHYSPKDSKWGILELLLANYLEQAIRYIDKEHLHGFLFKESEEDEEISFSETQSWWNENSQKRESLASFGLTVDEYGTVEGNCKTITRWLNSTEWKDTDDAYYGAIHYFWDDYTEISQADADVLIRLGLVKVL
jgi:hypothetical protein